MRFKYKYKNNVNFRLKVLLRSRIRDTLNGNYKIGSSIKDLGCTVNELINHLESLFEPGMTWKNYGCKKNNWSLDHIKPLSKFDLTKRNEFLEACHYKNLQPMWHIENIKKGNK